MTTYNASHPMLVSGKGDPARGEWKPWEKKEKGRGKRKKS